MGEWLDVSWKMLMLRGVIGIGFGIVALIWPITTLAVLAVFWGFWAIFDGAGSLVGAFEPAISGGRRTLLVVMAVIAFLAGFIAILQPLTAAVALTWILGIWLIVRGLFELFGAFSSQRMAPRWLLVLAGVLSIVVGIIFTARPGSGSVALAIWLGILALAWGIVFLAAGFSVRSEAKSVGEAAMAS